MNRHRVLAPNVLKGRGRPQFGPWYSRLLVCLCPKDSEGLNDLDLGDLE